jgi:hypothetical protein
MSITFADLMPGERFGYQALIWFLILMSRTDAG